MAKATGAKTRNPIESSAYTHPTQELALRPEVGTQPQFKKKKPAKTYRYDSSLAPELNWDGQNPARELGEWLLAIIDEASRLPIPADPNQRPFTFPEPRRFLGNDGKPLLEVTGLQDAVDQLKRLSQPFLIWSGKAERLSFDVPTLPLFVHERLSTQAIIETLRTHEKETPQADLFELFGDPRRSVRDQVVKAYEYKDKWVNRLILGDSLVVMNSLLEYEGLGGQVQMIYIDPPYGVKFGSNFQPFLRKSKVQHNNDAELTREPEMIRAYRDTWELGLHSYLNYLRDRLLLARDLLDETGSIFVQIGDENVSIVRDLLDEIFGQDGFVSLITIKKTSGASSSLLPGVSDFLLWYAKDIERVRYRQLYRSKDAGGDGAGQYRFLELPDGRRRGLHDGESPSDAAELGRLFRYDNLTSQRPPGDFPVEYEGRMFLPGRGYWKTSPEGMQRLKMAKRLGALGNTLCYIRYLDDFPVFPVTNVWEDTVTSGFDDPKSYVVRTHPMIVERCINMTTRPGDLVLDPTCGGGTTAYAAEKLGRRWITIDTSRVPLALTRQRVLTATFTYYKLFANQYGPASGFLYERRENKKGEEIGGIVPHVMLKDIANGNTSSEELIVDRPIIDDAFVRVSGPFVVEGTIPTPLNFDTENLDSSANSAEQQSFVDRMIEVLRKAPVIRLAGNRTIELRNVRPPARSLALHAEALVEATAEGQKATLADAVAAADELNIGRLPLSRRPVAVVFGPENGAVSEALTFEAAREAFAKSFTHLYVIGFSIQPNAQKLVEECEDVVGIAATWVPATPDLMMGDLLKNMRSSQIFAVAGRPDVRLATVSSTEIGTATQFRAELHGLDTFDPVSMDVHEMRGDDVPCWMLDTDYNGLVFHGVQVFFPRTSAWDSLKKALHATHDPAVWDHLAGTTSAPFEAGEHRQIAVKVIDDRGNELMVVKKLDEPS